MSGAAKPEEDKEGVDGDTQGNNDELQSSLKLNENEAVDNDEDEDFFSSYKSERVLIIGTPSLRMPARQVSHLCTMPYSSFHLETDAVWGHLVLGAGWSRGDVA